MLGPFGKGAVPLWGADKEAFRVLYKGTALFWGAKCTPLVPETHTEARYLKSRQDSFPAKQAVQ